MSLRTVVNQSFYAMCSKRISVDRLLQCDYSVWMNALPVAREKEIRALQSAHARRSATNFLVEGARAVDTMRSHGVRPEYYVLSSSDLTDYGRQIVDRLDSAKCPIYTCDSRRFAKLAATEHAQGILAIVAKSALRVSEENWSQSRLLVYLDRIADPGNLGTIIRTAAAFGVDLVALSPGCADRFNPKALRATAGSVFSLPVADEVDSETLIAKLQSNSIDLYGAAGDSAVHLRSLKVARAAAIAIGAEATGLSEEIRGACRQIFSIPTLPKVESLNAAIAAGLAIEHFAAALSLV